MNEYCAVLCKYIVLSLHVLIIFSRLSHLKAHDVAKSSVGRTYEEATDMMKSPVYDSTQMGPLPHLPLTHKDESRFSKYYITCYYRCLKISVF